MDDALADPGETQAIDAAALFDPEITTLDRGAVISNGRYEIANLVGRGGMAEVYRARDTVLDRDVAVKIMRDGVRDPAAELRFAGEARVLGGLAHPGLVTVHDAGASGGRPFIVMELVEGSSLAQLVRESVVGETQARRMIGEVAEALAVVHATDVIHRDVKPANILVDEEGNARLSDFGIARLASEVGQHTATGAAIGTVSYLAPEQVSGGEPSTSIDIYALGLVLLELLTGVKAFTGTVTEAAIARLSNGPNIPDQVAPDLRALITEMTALDPDDRPSATDVSKRLLNAPAQPAPTRGGARRAERQSISVGWVGVALVVLAVVVALMLALLL